jgi:hypothetical protein
MGALGCTGMGEVAGSGEGEGEAAAGSAAGATGAVGGAAPLLVNVKVV